METQVRQHLHHLPNRKTNTVYILALTLSPIINMVVRLITFEIYWSDPANAIRGQHVVPPDHWIFTIISSVLEAILVLLG